MVNIKAENEIPEMQQQIIEKIKKILTDLYSESGIDLNEKEIRLQENKNKEHGDYASNIAMVIAKDLSEDPKIVAKRISNNFPIDDQIIKVEVAGPGFINFFIAASTHGEVLNLIDSKKASYGRSDDSMGKVLIEYVSSNPTGPLHVGHGRGAVFGSVLAKLLTVVGYEVDEEYYVNDYGRQMNILAVSVWVRYLQISHKDLAMTPKGYQGDYVKSIAKDLKKEEKEKYLLNENNHKKIIKILSKQEEESDIDLLISFMREVLNKGSLEIRSFSLDKMLKIIKSDLKSFGVEHNLWFFESSLYKEQKTKKSDTDEAISLLQSEGFVYEEEGAMWFKSSDFRDDKDRVLKRSNGEHTYFSSDVAYHYDKYKRSYDRIINVWGSDHHGYLPRVNAAMKAIGMDVNKLEVVFIQFVNLLRNGEKIPMSTRSGEFITLKELVDEVTAEAARFFYINRKSDQHLDFDLSLAKEQSKDNPLYYVQYAHARICSVFKKHESVSKDIP
ncbi:MAG TPA: arginine--tRNA ligase, partial [SAR86 cluster bacterium]|nr:arginine--tRNA ligase [SAR86 cluster bacterium]